MELAHRDGEHGEGRSDAERGHDRGHTAQFLGLDQLGIVASGKNADFPVLDANPLDNIANTRRISRVYLRGAEVDRAAMKKQLNGGH
jgi:adenine deaminase